MGVDIVRDGQKKLIILDCNIMLKKYGMIAFDKSYELVKNELWQIGSKYGVEGTTVFKIYMDYLSKRN